MRSIIVLALAVLTAGCVHSGRYVGEKQLSQVVAGQTTERDLVRIIGEPMSRTYNADGSQAVGWTYVRFGLFFGLGTNAQTVSLSIGPDGTVSGYSRSSSKPIAAAPISKPAPAATAPSTPILQSHGAPALDKKAWQDQQIQKLQDSDVSYEEYQVRYRKIMDQ
jgi:hypothetical protein